MENREKSKFWHIVGTQLITAIISILIGALFTLILQVITMESVAINISPSVNIDGYYVTVVGLQNFKTSTLSELSLYLDEDICIQDIQSDDKFIHKNQYISIDHISPKQQYSFILRTDKPISKRNLFAESEYKTYIHLSRGDSPVLLQTLSYIVPTAIIMFMAFILQIWTDQKNRNKLADEVQVQLNTIRNKIDSEREEYERKQRIYEEEEKHLKSNLQEITGKLHSIQTKYQALQREATELKLYSISSKSDLRKELTFWKDTVRKLLYNGQKQLQTPESVMSEVTSMLKTYTTRESTDANFDEIMYLGRKIADFENKKDTQDESPH